MRISRVRVWLTSPTAVYVKIETDEGVSGYGEATVLYYPQSVAAMLHDLEGYLIGQDPFRIEYLWQSLFRDLFMRGGPTHQAAISGVDMALYDLKGKALGVPVYELLGGRVRDRVRLYGHVAADTRDGIVKKAVRLAETGCTMIRFRGFHGMDARREFDFQAGVDEQIEYLAAIRQAVGEKVDLILECHGRYDLPWAVKAARAAEPYHPYFIEDPIRQENPSSMALLRAQTCLPIATGERAHSRWDFRELFIAHSIDYARPDVCHCGGITEMMKIAAFAEVFGISIVPHNTQGPLAMAACLHAAFAIDNVAVVEAAYCNPENRDTVRAKAAKSWPEAIDGYSLPPTGTGLGVEIDEEILDRNQAGFKPPMQPRLRAYDGSVRDW
jgi:galactonate dehydratase